VERARPVSVPTASGDGDLGDVQATFCATLVDEWCRAGITDAVVCPGSRSTPMAVALADAPGLRVHVRLDERSAGFFALGLAARSGRPVVVCTTSGTAAAELHPAACEADLGRVPLICATADRPPELHHVGAAQTMEQRGLYASAVRFEVAPGVPDAATAATWRSLGARVAAEAAAGPTGPGPVHLCLAFRDPLVGHAGVLPPGRPDGAPWHQVEGAATAPVPREVDGWPARRGLIVAGAGSGDPAAVLALAGALGWPLLADPRSGCRLPHPRVVAAADALLRDREVAQALAPEEILVLGMPWASKVVGGFLADAARRGACCTVVDPWWRWIDPDRVATTVLRGDPGEWAASVCRYLGSAGIDGGADADGAGGTGPGGWASRWQAYEEQAQRALGAILDQAAEVSEPAVARRILAAVPAGATVYVSSSMPVRDLEWYGAPRSAPPLVLANRGVNGIDGVCSSALGAAAACAPSPVVALVGDLAFLHDVSALVGAPPGSRASRGGGPAPSTTIVVVDNRGGGIFSFLPQAEQLDAARFELLFGTPQRGDVAAVARGFGLDCLDVATMAELDGALAECVGAPGTSVIRVAAPDRAENTAVHDGVHAAVAQALHAADDRSGAAGARR